jgi:hypothetical protein
MKKMLTAMTAMTLALQANDSLGQELDDLKNETDNTEFSNQFYSESSNENTLGASGSYGDVFQASRFIDLDNSGGINSGDLMIHEVRIENSSSINASGVFFDAQLDNSLVSLLPNAVTHSQGTVLIGNSASDSDVIVNLNNINSAESATLSYVYKINPIADGVVHEFNHNGLVYSSNGVEFYDMWSGQTYFISGNPTTAYEEDSIGDMSNHFETLTKIELSSELERVSGTVGGVGEDFEDCFQFDIGANRYFHNIKLEDISFTNDNESTLFRVYYGLPDIKDPRGNLQNRDLSHYDIGQYIFGYHSYYGQGTYSVCLIEATPGQSFSLIIETEINDPIFKSGFD